MYVLNYELCQVFLMVFIYLRSPAQVSLIQLRVGTLGPVLLASQTLGNTLRVRMTLNANLRLGFSVIEKVVS